MGGATAAALEEIRLRLVVLRGQPSKEAQEHKQLMFHIFFSGGGKQLLAERMILSKLPNGDWRNRRQVEYYTSPDIPPPRSKVAISQLLEAGLCHVLAGKKPSLWARHRWTGADLAVEELGRLECVHGLLKPTYQRFIHSKREAQISTGPQEGEDEEMAVDEQSAPSVQLPSASASLSAGTTALDPQQAGAEATAITPGTMQETARSAQEHARDRGQAAEWLSSDVLPYLILLRLGLASVSDLMHQMFAVGSDNWELQQQAAAADALELPSGRRPLREYMLTVAAQGDLERSFFGQVQDLVLSQLHWKTVPEAFWTVQFNAMIFKVFSRLACMVEQRIAHPHRVFPLCVFQIPHHPETALPLSRSAPCLMDAWSRQLLETYPSFTGPGFMETLELHCQLAATSIGVIESRHSSVRRQLASKSVQTHSLQMPSLSSEWIMQNIRRGRASQQQEDSSRAPGVKRRLEVCHQQACITARASNWGTGAGCISTKTGDSGKV